MERGESQREEGDERRREGKEEKEGWRERGWKEIGIKGRENVVYIEGERGWYIVEYFLFAVQIMKSRKKKAAEVRELRRKRESIDGVHQPAQRTSAT